MNDKKNNYLRVQLDTKTELAFRKIVELKGLTIQSVLEDLVKGFIFENLDCILTNDRK